MFQLFKKKSTLDKLQGEYKKMPKRGFYSIKNKPKGK